MSILCKALLGLLAALAARAVMAAPPEAVGVIVDYSPASATLYLLRNHAVNRVTAQIATQVAAGDRIDLPGSSTVTIELSDGKRIVSSGPGSWTVPSASPLGLVGSLLQRLEFSIDPTDVRTMTAITRSSAGCPPNQTIAMPALGPDPHLREGTRSLWLSWTGGCPPFEVSLHSQRLRVTRHAVPEHQVRLDRLPLSAGTYAIDIRDANAVTGHFTVSAGSATPTLPPELLGQISHLDVIAQSLWLADVDHGNWRLESITRLLPLADHGDRLAQRELQKLLWATGAP